VRAPSLRGEEGDDVTKDIVGEVADVVDEPFFFFRQPPLLHGSGDHPHGGAGVAAGGVDGDRRSGSRAAGAEVPCAIIKYIFLK
jgi:hypothetical protein